MKKIIVGILAVTLLAVMTFSTLAMAGDQRYEYKVVQSSVFSSLKSFGKKAPVADTLQRLIDKQVSEGWRLVNFNPDAKGGFWIFIFERSVEK